MRRRLTVPLPFELVDNAESLIDVADLVFVDAVGTGYSEAVAPYTNQSFWGVDGDAALMRDFIARYVAVHQRAASPTFVLGESYGTTRAAVLADLMLAAGMRLDGVILLSSVLDYNSNCDVFAPGESELRRIPAELRRDRRVARPRPAAARATPMRMPTCCASFATSTYGPAATAFAATRQPAPPGLIDQLVALTGAPATAWDANLDLDPLTFRQRARARASCSAATTRASPPPTGSALAASGDPSSALIAAPFAAAARQLFSQELGYVASADYTTLSSAISSWDFRHDGRPLPDTIVDLGAALARQPGLRVLSLAGYHDVATPFRQTELDLARLGAQPTVFARVYPGGHMTYLDDASRRAPQGRHRRLRARRADGARARAAPTSRSAASGRRRVAARRPCRPGAARRSTRPRASDLDRTRSRKAATPGCRPPCAFLRQRLRRAAPRSRRACRRRSPSATATSTGRRARRGSTSTSSRGRSRPRRCAAARPSGCRPRGCPGRTP